MKTIIAIAAATIGLHTESITASVVCLLIIGLTFIKK